MSRISVLLFMLGFKALGLQGTIFGLCLVCLWMSRAPVVVHCQSHWRASWTFSLTKEIEVFRMFLAGLFVVVFPAIECV